MAPIAFPYHPGIERADPPAPSPTTTVEDAAFVPTTGSASYPLIGVGIAAWVIICIALVCIWLGRTKRGRAGYDWEVGIEKPTGRWSLGAFFKSSRSGSRRGRGAHDRGLPTAVLTVEAKIPVEPKPIAPPPTPQPVYTSPPRLARLSPPRASPTAALSPGIATSSFHIYGNAYSSGERFWAPSWALQAAQAKMAGRRSPPLSPICAPSDTSSPASMSGFNSPARTNRPPSLRSPSPSSKSPSLSTRGWTTPPSTTYAIDFPEVPASIVARIRREPLPLPHFI